MRYKNIAGRFFGLVSKHACDGQTDGRTDGQNYDSQDRASIARAVKRQLGHRLSDFRRLFTIRFGSNITDSTEIAGFRSLHGRFGQEGPLREFRGSTS